MVYLVKNNNVFLSLSHVETFFLTQDLVQHIKTSNPRLTSFSSLTNYYFNTKLYFICFHGDFQFHVVQGLHDTAVDFSDLTMGLVHSSVNDEEQV